MLKRRNKKKCLYKIRSLILSLMQRLFMKIEYFKKKRSLFTMMKFIPFFDRNYFHDFVLYNLAFKKPKWMTF